MHQNVTRPGSDTRDAAGNAKTAAPPSALPPGVRCEAAIAYQRLANALPPGLHRALRHMVESLLAVADGRPIGMFSDLIVQVSASRVLVGPSSDDRVVYGIQRRFTVRATQTCHRCGRKGRARQDLGGRVRCARCAAPALLVQAIDLALDQTWPMRDISNSAVAAGLPPLLRPMFRAHVEHHSQIAQGTTDDMSRVHFKAWLKLLHKLASEPQIRQAHYR